jgi:glycosyltransferase involved in cell wall biosynthesis
MKKILIFHPTLMDDITGSSETLLREIAKFLFKSDKFDIALAYGTKNQLSDDLKTLREYQLLPFFYRGISSNFGSKIVGMKPLLPEIIEIAKPDLIITLISEPFQKSIKEIPRRIPLILISPFGEFSTNGNLRKIYVSGKNNIDKLERLGIKGATLFFNPIPIPDFNVKKSLDDEDKETVIYGRIGRADSFIFDPISIYAFKKLEEKYGDKVKYIYVNPCEACINLSKSLGIKNIEFREWLSKEQLNELYTNIDILAHARRDGETLGVAIGEAMLFQNPIVSHKTHHFNEHLFLIREPYGKASNADDVEGYFEAMDFFFTRRKKLGTLGCTARDFAIEHFDYELISSRIIDDCAEACASTEIAQRISSNYKLSLYNLLRRIKYSLF